MKDFKKTYSFEKRHSEAKRILEKYPDRLPVIVEKNQNSNVPDIDKHKYLVPDELTIGQFIYVIRKRLKLPAEKAIFLFTSNMIPPNTTCLRDVYQNHKDMDSFLYMTYCGENVFG